MCEITDNKNEYTLHELAEKTNTAPRTVRYYISKDLLPPPIRAGRNAAYNDTHIKRLETIRLNKNQGLTLNEIRTLVSTNQQNTILPEPTIWQRYSVTEYLQVNIRSDTPPWRQKSILKQIQRMKNELAEE